MSVSWPQDQTDTLTRLWQAGRTSGQISLEMGITRNQVMGKASRLGLKHTRITKPRVNYWRPSKPKDQKPPTPLKPQAQTTHPIPFLEADHRTCKWPLWSGPKTGKVCGAKPVPATPYCLYHHGRATA
jgi:hypothetical protein